MEYLLGLKGIKCTFLDQLYVQCKKVLSLVLKIARMTSDTPTLHLFYIIALHFYIKTLLLSVCHHGMSQLDEGKL